MKKILLLVRGIPEDKDPMWGNFELDQAKALNSYGHKVVCMSVDRRIRFYWRKIGITREVKDGIVMYNIFFPLPYKVLPRFLNNLVVNILSKKLYKHVVAKEGGFDLVHGHYLPNIRIATTIKKLSGMPVVGTEHWSELKRSEIKSSVIKDAWEAYPQADFLISVSRPLKEILEARFNTGSAFVGCVIDDVFKFVPKKDDGFFRFIAVGSLFDIKGFDVAIKAFARAGFDKSVKFHIVGDGGKRSYLNDLVSSLGVADQVVLEGRKTRSEIMNLMAVSSVYILSSKSENFATACMEALSAGLPAVMTRCGGPEDFVDESNSILVPVGDIDAMSGAMKSMFENVDRYDRLKISQGIRSKYSSESIAQQLDAIYEKLI